MRGGYTLILDYWRSTCSGTVSCRNKPNKIIVMTKEMPAADKMIMTKEMPAADKMMTKEMPVTDKIIMMTKEMPADMIIMTKETSIPR